MNPIANTVRTYARMPQDIPTSASRLAIARRILVRVGVCLVVPSLCFLALAMTGVVRADILAVGGNSGLRMIAAVAIFGCLMAAIGYWDDYERS